MKHSPINLIASIVGIALTGAMVALSSSSPQDIAADPDPVTLAYDPNASTEPIAFVASSSEVPVQEGPAASAATVTEEEPAPDPQPVVEGPQPVVSEPSPVPVQPVPAPTPAPKPAPSPAPANTSGYTDGTYSTSASYRTPGSTETINVSLTLKDGEITAASVSQQAADHESRRYQNSFASGYKTYVIGKSIDSLRLSRVSGASLTTSGFNKALSQIRSQASA
jgi:uncharacterized protein with FMN-binding domain